MLKPSVILIVSIICRDLTIRLNWASAHRIRRGRARAVARGVKIGRPAKLTPHQQREAYAAPAWRSKPGRPACRPRVGPARLCCMDVMDYISEAYNSRPRGLSPKNRLFYRSLCQVGIDCIFVIYTPLRSEPENPWEK